MHMNLGHALVTVYAMIRRE